MRSNDVFKQIELIPKPMILQIQLAEGVTDIFQVRQGQDIRRQTIAYCRKKGLNLLAAQLIESKIYEAQSKLQLKSISKSNLQRYSLDNISKENKHNNEIEDDPCYQKNKTNRLYLQAALRRKKLQEETARRKQQIKLKEEEELTFKPLLNSVSERIVEFRKSHPRQQKTKQNIVMQEEINYSFKPKINAVSALIVSCKDEREHFNQMYKAKKKEGVENSFKPKINEKSRQVIQTTFEQRLNASVAKLHSKCTEERHKCSSKIQCTLKDSNNTFKPVIGRPPLQRQQQPIWDKLYYLHAKNNNKSQHFSIHHKSSIQKINQEDNKYTQYYYQSLIQKRINKTFALLDSDQDGLISNQKIQIQILPGDILKCLKPIFQQMEQLQCVLDQTAFKKAVKLLLKDATPLQKGYFVSNWEKNVAQQKQPQRQAKRAISLYEEGMRKTAEKQYRLERERAKIIQQEMNMCSFKPSLNNTSKYYIAKLTNK